MPSYIHPCFGKKKRKADIERIKSVPLLTVGEMDNFLEQGGIVNFVLKKKKVKFEINLDAAKQAKLLFKSTVLKLAKRVIQTKKESRK